MWTSRRPSYDCQAKQIQKGVFFEGRGQFNLSLTNKNTCLDRPPYVLVLGLDLWQDPPAWSTRRCSNISEARAPKP